MNKKIFAFILGGTMLAAGAFAFAGCGHKHDYEIYYQVADCNNEGYTMHVCKDCGYMYADEFIAPYGHAYRDEYHLLDESRDSHYTLDTLNEDNWDLFVAADEICVHQACAFCDWGTGMDPVGLPESELTNFNEMMQNTYHPGANYTPVLLPWSPEYRRMMMENFLRDLKSGKYSVNNMEIKYPEGRSGVRSDSTADADDFVLKTTIRSNEVNFDESEYDIIYIVMPDSINVIEDSAFGGSQKIERVYLSQNLKTIGKDVFKNSSLDSVIIPKSLQSIGSGAFANCGDLKIVYFSGTQEEWNKIQIADGNDSLKSAKIYYYSEKEPSSAGNFWRYVYEEPTIW